ncbi:MAG: hypothetical protein ACYTG3_14715 [Planctomycetota bacterium]|jgi:hypothetical protein
MRIPQSFRTPEEGMPGWLLVVLVGGTVLVMVILFFALTWPWFGPA